MDSSNLSYDRLSNLPDLVLVMILSYLPFKEAVRTSIFGKRWRTLFYETRNVSFKEAEYINQRIFNERSRSMARESFVSFMFNGVHLFRGQFIDTFEISLSNAMWFAGEIHYLIYFAVSKNVKHLKLDFSDPKWRMWTGAKDHDFLRDDDSTIHMPACVYNLSTLVSLKVYACWFDPTRFANPGLLRTLSIGWINLRKLETLISNTPLLERLSISYCEVLDVVLAAENMKEFEFENYSFPLMSFTFDLPNADIFKYSGEVFHFNFKRMKKVIKEVYLDFNQEGEYDVPNSSSSINGGVISGYLNSLKNAATISVCPYLLQCIPESEFPHILFPVNTRHLVLRTRLHPKEFVGIRMLLENCQDLETLTFDIQPPYPYETCYTYRSINPRTFWLDKKMHRCMRMTMKVVVVKNYGGMPNEVNVLKYLIESGHYWRGYLWHALEKVDIYLRHGLDHMQMMVARATAEMLQSLSYRVQVLLHYP